MEQGRSTLNKSCSSISNRVLKLALPSWPSHLVRCGCRVQTWLQSKDGVPNTEFRDHPSLSEILLIPPQFIRTD